VHSLKTAKEIKVMKNSCIHTCSSVEADLAVENTLLKCARARVASKQTSWAAVVVKIGADEVEC